MNDDQAPNEIEGEERTKARRKFLKDASQVAVTTPAVALLLSAGAKKARAGTKYPVGDGPDTALDDGPPGADQSGGIDDDPGDGDDSAGA